MKISNIRIVCVIAVVIIQMFNSNPVKSQRLECYILSLPENILLGVNKVAIVNIQGEFGDDIAAAILNQSLKEDRGMGSQVGGGFYVVKEAKTFMKGARTNIYQFIERDQINRIIQEQKFNVSGIVDDNQQMAEVGKLLGVNALMFGKSSYTSKDEETKTEYKDKYGNTQYQYCTRRTVTLSAEIKIVSVETGQILGIKTAVSSNSDKQCDDNRRNVTSARELARGCISGAAEQLLDYITPSYSYIRLDLKKVQNKEYKERIDEAKEYIVKQELDRAYPIYKALFDKDPYNPEIAYNLGILHEVIGDYVNADEYYKTAYELNTKDDEFSKSLQRNQKNMELVKVFDNLGMKFSYEYRSVSGNALADKITTNGSKTDRVDVYKEPSKDSEVVVKVPGGVQFTVIKKTDDWIQIQLRDNKEGYVYKDDVR